MTARPTVALSTGTIIMGKIHIRIPIAFRARSANGSPLMMTGICGVLCLLLGWLLLARVSFALVTLSPTCGVDYDDSALFAYTSRVVGVYYEVWFIEGDNDPFCNG